MHAEYSIVDELTQLSKQSGLKTWRLAGKELLPVVQGGMGVGVSAGGLAGAVAGLGAVGTISSVDLRRLHPDLMAQTGHLDKELDAGDRINAANLVALDREIQKAKHIACGHGLVAVNIMKALTSYEAYVAQSVTSGADAVVVGAGLPLDLPDLVVKNCGVALIPILSDARGVQLVVKKWDKKGRLPDAIVLEHPGLAGGHLGAAKLEDLHDERFNFEVAVPQILEFFRTMGIEGQIPLIAAGGIHCMEDIQKLQNLGVTAVQLGTAFATTQECDAAMGFKQILAKAKPSDLVEFVSVAGLPARAVLTPWLKKYLRLEDKLKQVAHIKNKCTMSFDCLKHCGLRDGNAGVGQFCIDKQLAHALRGELDKGLFFRGAGILPFGQEILPVKALMQWLLGGVRPLLAHGAIDV
jgi:nitronate monooxygenase